MFFKSINNEKLSELLGFLLEKVDEDYFLKEFSECDLYYALCNNFFSTEFKNYFKKKITKNIHLLNDIFINNATFPKYLIN